MAKEFEALQSLPRLIGDLGISIADAQIRLDKNYMDNLAAFSTLIQPLIKESAASDADEASRFLELAKSLGPSRYQYTETIMEVRADLQMASVEEKGGSIGGRLLAVAVNASYLKRTASDFRAAALIRTVLHAIPTSEQVMDKLLSQKNEGIKTDLPGKDLFEPLQKSFENLPKLKK